MSDNQLRALVAAYLDEAKLMQLATSVDDQPWSCSVWFAADDDLNVYWFSATNRRHSLELESNRLVSAAFVAPGQTPADAPRGLQLQGTASIIDSAPEAALARSLYVDRIFAEEKVDAFANNPDRPHRFYKIVPSQFVLFDAVNYPTDPRQQLDL